MTEPWQSSRPAHVPQPVQSTGDACTAPGCSHITEGADDPNLPMPAQFWRGPRCMVAWLRQRDVDAQEDRPELVDEHDPGCTQHGPRTGADRVAEVGWLRHNAPAEPQYTRRGDRAS